MTERAELVPVLRIERLARRRMPDASRATPRSCRPLPRLRRRDATASRRRRRISCASAAACRERSRGGSMSCTTAVLSASKISSEPSLVSAQSIGEIVEADACRPSPRAPSDGGGRSRCRRCAMNVSSSSRLPALARHVGVEVPDLPAVGDRHVAGIGLAVDEDDAIFAEQAVLARIVDEARDEEFLRPGARREIALHRRAIVDLGKADAGMRSARPDDDGKGKIARDLGQGFARSRSSRQLLARQQRSSRECPGLRYR